MTVWIRIGLYIFAGWLYGSGYIGDEVKEIITTDPAVSAAIEAGITAAIASLPVGWWQWAKRKGWAT